VVLTLCHHPYCWLLDGTELRSKITNRSHVHITGHVHKHDFKDTPEHVHLRAGALQPPRREEEDSRCNVITLQIQDGSSGPELEVTLVPLVWNPDVDCFMIDTDHCKTCSVAVQPPAHQPTAPPDAGRLRALSRLTERLGALPYSDRLHCARHIGITSGPVFAMPAGEQIGAIVARATENDQLEILWTQVELRHGRQSDDSSNPFREARP
jgi:hypothetical protein